MRFDEAVRRLATFPDPLPDGAVELTPVLQATGGAARRPRWPTGDRVRRPAGVLVLLFPDDAGIARVVLTERAARDGYHSGEVSLPGGKAEPGDADIVATALREAAEEVGLDAVGAGVRVMGRLETFVIPVSDFEVTPVVAVAARRPVLVASVSEVARIVEPPLAAFLPDAPIALVERTIDGWPLRYGAYDVDGLSVWGATARILSQLGAVLAPVTERVLIRRADEGDAVAITALVADAYDKYVERIGRLPKPVTADQHAAVRDHEVWVAVDALDDTLVGVLELIVEPARLFIENVAVAPSRQGKGLGRQLLDLAESEARRRGYDEIGLETNERFVEDLAIYARRDYRETGRTLVGGTIVIQLAKRFDRA